MSAWDELKSELDAWAEDGKTATFWWRDDDAVERTPALDRLLALRADAGVPLAIAAIPANARPSLPEALDGDGIDVLQHGYAHKNHRDDTAKKAELGADRALWDIAAELAAGRSRLIELFGDDGWLGVMVPPWNRIDDTVTALLPGLGYHGLTTFRARPAAEAAPGLHMVNTHIDIVDWAGTREFATDEAVLGAAVAHLRCRRTGAADPGEATGLLTHHLAHDGDCWRFIAKFIDATARHPAAKWLSARALFPAPA